MTDAGSVFGLLLSAKGMAKLRVRVTTACRSEVSTFQCMCRPGLQAERSRVRRTKLAASTLQTPRITFRQTGCAGARTRTRTYARTLPGSDHVLG